MGQDTVIRVENVSKLYRLGTIDSRTFAEDVKRWLYHKLGKDDPVAKVGFEKELNNRNLRQNLWALKDINFEVKRGEVLGIIGKNGAGKSTLLKILSRITQPTSGEIRINGRIASLLEVGTGFHPELTGRENIFMNGTILGMKKEEIKNKFDEILDFSGVAKFVDTPVKRYSSGMYVRLAFAVAAHLEPEILVLDEVLAVGDAEFQKKCLGKMKDVAGHGRTVLFVSHNMGAVKNFCTRCIFLKDGQIAEDGDPVKVVSTYFQGNINSDGRFLVGKESGDKNLVIESATLKNRHGEVTNEFEYGDDLTVEIEYNALEDIPSPYLWVGIKNKNGGLLGANGLIDGCRSSKINCGNGKFSVTFKELKLMPQSYTLSMGARSSGGVESIVRSKDIGFFQIISKLSAIGFGGTFADSLAFDSTPVMSDYIWNFGNGEIYEVKAADYVKR